LRPRTLYYPPLFKISAPAAAMNLKFHFLSLSREIRFVMWGTPLTDFQIDRHVTRIV
jgi:hypothetical protein